MTIYRSFLLILIVLFGAACGGPQQVAVPTAPAPALQPAPPETAGGNLIMTLGARDPTTLDPALVGDTTSAFVVRQLFSGLVRLDTNLEVQPDLAASWEVSPDGTVYTFTLRPDARFADGTPITAEDVQYTLERATDPNLAPALPAQTYLRDIVGVREKLAGNTDTISGLRVLDPQTIEITIDAPKSFFLAKLANPTSFIVDRRTVEASPRDWTSRPNGSGPFMIERWRNDDVLVLQRNPNFYRDPAQLDQITMLMGAAASNPLVLYEEGEIDLVEVPTYALPRFQDPDNPLHGDLVSVPQLSLFYIGMNVSIPPFDDPQVREAFTLLIDRTRLTDLTLRGSATPARGVLPPGMPGYNADLPPPAADIAAARQLIAASRYGSVANLPPIVAYGGGWTTTLSEIAADELGLEIEVRAFETFGDYLAALEANEFALFSMGWIADYADPENFLDVLFRSGSGENHMLYANPEVDALLDAAATAESDTERWRLYREAEQRIIADAPIIPLYHDVGNYLIKPYVHGLEVTPMGILDLAPVELVRGN